MKAEGCNAQKYIATLQLSYANAIIRIYTLIPHSHGNGLVIGGVYSRYMSDYLMSSRIYARKVIWPPDHHRQ